MFIDLYKYVLCYESNLKNLDHKKYLYYMKLFNIIIKIDQAYQS
jgi:hypothetical protein